MFRDGSGEMEEYAQVGKESRHQIPFRQYPRILFLRIAEEFKIIASQLFRVPFQVILGYCIQSHLPRISSEKAQKIDYEPSQQWLMDLLVRQQESSSTDQSNNDYQKDTNEAQAPAQ